MGLGPPPWQFQSNDKPDSLCRSLPLLPLQPPGMEQSRGGDCGRRTREECRVGGAGGGCFGGGWWPCGRGRRGRREEEVEKAWTRAAEGTREGLRWSRLDRV